MFKPLLFDIETVLHPQALDRGWIDIHEPGISDLTNDALRAVLRSAEMPVSGTKDVLVERIMGLSEETDRIALRELEAYLEEALQTGAQDEISKAPLDADLNAILSIGIRDGIDSEIEVWYAEDLIPEENRLTDAVEGVFDIPINNHTIQEVPWRSSAFATEQKMILSFWTRFKEHGRRCVGYGIIGFDFPVLLRRSMDLGILPGVFPDLRRYSTNPTKDLGPILTNWAYGGMKPMKWIASRYGIYNPTQGTSGSDVKDMTVSEALEYTASDVHLITEIYKMMDGVYWVSEIGK